MKIESISCGRKCKEVPDAAMLIGAGTGLLLGVWSNPTPRRGSPTSRLVLSEIIPHFTKFQHARRPYYSLEARRVGHAFLNMFSKISYLLLAGIATLLLSCEKNIAFEGTPEHNSQLFIECILHPGENPKVQLSNSVSFFNEKVTPQETFVHNAEVEISDGVRTFTLLPDSTFDKFRCRWQPFYTTDQKIVYGNTYELIVRHQGQTYTASTTINQSKVNLREVEHTAVEFFDVYGGHDGVILRFNDVVGEGNFYRFQMDRLMNKTRIHASVLDVIKSTCIDSTELFMTTDLGRTIFDDINNDGGDMELYIEVSFEYRKGDATTVYLQSLDAKSAAFFDDLDNQLQSILNPFIEPTFLHSTIEGTLGVFGSAVRSDPVLFIYPVDDI